MKRVLFFIGLFLSVYGQAQTFNPTAHIQANDAIGFAQPTPPDARSMFYDAVHTRYRDYQSTTEVNSYLNIPTFRTGHFPIYIHLGGTLGGTGIWSGGITQVWFYKDSTANANLVRWYTDSTTTGAAFLIANNLSEGIPGTIRTNIGLGNVNNTSDATKWAATATLTNKTISGLSNTFSNIPNSALSNSQIGLTFTSNPASDISVTATPAALGASLTANFPNASVSQRGPLRATDFSLFLGKVDSIRRPSGSVNVYQYNNGVQTLAFTDSIGSGGGADSAVNTGLWLSQNIVGTLKTLYADSAAMAAYFLRIGDSITSYVTPTQLYNAIPGTPGIDDVLSVNQSLTTSRTINANGNDLILINAGTYSLNSISVTGDTSGVFSANAATAQMVATMSNLTQSSSWYVRPEAVQIISPLVALNTPLVSFSTYGTGTHLGLRAYPLAVTSTGDIIEDTTTSGGGGGSITGAGNLSPLFTTGVSGSTITFAQSNAAANTAFGNFTGSSAAPGFGKVPLAAQATGPANYLMGYDGSGNPAALAPDTLKVRNRVSGTGVQVGNISADTLYLNNLVAGSNITLTKQADSSILIASTGGGGGVSQVFGKSPIIITGTDTVAADTSFSNVRALVTQNQKPYHWNVANLAVKDSTVDNTLAFQRIIDSCHLNGGGTVFIPAGVWSISKIHTYFDVGLKGEGIGSVLKSRTADTLLTIYSDRATLYRGHQIGYQDISGLVFSGHNLGVVGISFQFAYWFSYSDLRYDSFTSTAMLMKACLTGTFNNILINDCPNGAILDSMNIPLAGGLVAPNLMKLINFKVYRSSNWALQVLNSQGAIELDNCDLTDNGVLHNKNTGAFYSKNFSSQAACVTFLNCWWEVNRGTLVYLDQNLSTNPSYTFINCVMPTNTNASYGIYTNFTHPTYINIIGTQIVNDSLDLFYNGNAFITLMGSKYGTDNQGAASYLYVRDLSVLYEGAYPKSTSPTTFVSAIKNGAGTGATASISAWSSNFGGTITINTGTSPAASDTLIIVGWPAAWVATGGDPIITPDNAAAASLAGSAQVWADTGGTFKYIYIFTNSTALLPSTTYKWHYSMTGK
jgi:hypothetical protein